MINKKIFVFCGGPKLYNDASKGLSKFDSDTPLFVRHCNSLKNIFQEIIYLVNDCETSKFQKISKDYSLQGVSFIPFLESSSTFDNFTEILFSYTNEAYLWFTYVDIFAQQSFWDDCSSLCSHIKIVPFKSRFPKVFLEPFTENVKGVSSYISNVPANTDYIFGGYFFCNRSEIIDSYKMINFERFSGLLEVEFFDQLALLNKLKAITFFKQWIHIDHFRDLKSIPSDE